MSDSAPITIELTSTGPHGHSSRLVLNGIDISHHTNRVELVADATDIARIRIGIMPRDGFRIALPASVSLVATVLPGYRLIETIADTIKTWHVEPIPRVPPPGDRTGSHGEMDWRDRHDESGHS